MSTSETSSKISEITQLARTFATASEKVVKEGKVGTNTTPVTTAALMVLIAGTTQVWPGGR